MVGTPSFQKTKDACIALLVAQGVLPAVRPLDYTVNDFQLTAAQGSGKSVCLSMTALDMMATCRLSPELRGKVGRSNS